MLVIGKLRALIAILAMGLAVCPAGAGSSPSPGAGPSIAAVPHDPLPPLPQMFPKIDRHPGPSDWRREAITSMPKYDRNSQDAFQVDLRLLDLSALDLADFLDDLLYADFDSRTKWPSSKMPKDFDWQKIMELGKDPGLGIRSLHDKGITGYGVGVAIIDQTLLVDHQEYTKQLKLYDIAMGPIIDPVSIIASLQGE